MNFETHLNNIITQLLDGTDAPILSQIFLILTDLPYFTSLPSSCEIGGNDTYLFGECENMLS